jgi:TPR repeat protein
MTGNWRMASVALAFSLLLAAPATAADEDDTSGFFGYWPAAPKLEIPKIDIPFWTDDLKKARRAYKRGDYDRAMKFFRRESDDGNMVADWYLGHMYRLGQGVDRDPAIAYSYYSRVSESFDPDEADHKRLRIVLDSQIHMANYVRRGVPDAGIKADPAGAAHTFLRIASTYGHPAAQFALGEMNILGQGVKKNPQQGLKWLTASARKRHPEAAAYLGDLYWNGQYVKQDQTRALMWYILAMETTDEEDKPVIFARYRDMLASSDEDMLLEAKARARVWSEQFPPPKN